MTELAADEPFEVSQTPAPFVMVPVWMVRDPAVTPGALRLYAALSAYTAGRSGSGAYPSIRQLSVDLGASRSAVKEWLDCLVRADAVRVESRHREDGGRTSSLYRLRTPWAGPPTPRAPQQPGGGRRGDQAPGHHSNHHELDPDLPRADPTGTASPEDGDGTLPLEGLQVTDPPITGGELVAAWINGCRALGAGDPIDAQIQRVGRFAKQVASSLQPADRHRALGRARELGGRGVIDLVQHWQPLSPSTPGRNADILARSMDWAEGGG